MWHVNKLNVASVCCREPRGIGFLEYTNPRDAEDAIYGLDRKIIDGKEVGVSTCQYQLSPLITNVNHRSDDPCYRFTVQEEQLVGCVCVCSLLRRSWAAHKGAGLQLHV